MWNDLGCDREKRVLLVEDDPALETLFDSIFRRLDFPVEMEWVTNAEEAIDKLEEARFELGGEDPYDLVIADIFLGGSGTGVDLWDVCQNAFPRMPSLLISGLPMRRFFDLIGSNNICPPYLQKPLEWIETTRTVKRVLETRQI